MLEAAAALAQEVFSREGYFEERQAALMPETSGAPLMPRFCLWFQRLIVHFQPVVSQLRGLQGRLAWAVPAVLYTWLCCEAISSCFVSVPGGWEASHPAQLAATSNTSQSIYSSVLCTRCCSPGNLNSCSMFAQKREDFLPRGACCQEKEPAEW